MIMKENNFQALHSPPGAGATFALGYQGHGGGFGIEQERVPDQDVFIGLKEGQNIKCFPFFKDASSDKMKSFTQTDGEKNTDTISVFPDLKREFDYGTDLFTAAKLSFELFNPVRHLPDPDTSNYTQNKETFVPAMTSVMTIDNREGTEDIEGFFAVNPMSGKQKLSYKTGGSLQGFISNEHYGFAVLPSEDTAEFCDFSLIKVYERPHKVNLLLAPLAGLSFRCPAGEKRAIPIVFGWYIGGIATSGEHECKYYYTRFFSDIVDVLKYALEKSPEWIHAARENNRQLSSHSLTPERRFLISQSVKSYYFSTMLFDDAGKARWAVNEGTFRMMNTFDLTVDHAFFELLYHPWSIKNQLESYVREYSYYDQCGLSFTHDQGTHNVFSPKGFSSYEIPNLDDCFSYMSQEQLCNWILTAVLYVQHTQDMDWLLEKTPVLKECLGSMEKRAGGESGNGIMTIDSSRCESGREITTYDSLDKSLGQAKENLYIAMKCWASYIALETMFLKIKNQKLARQAKNDANILADTICGYYREDLGYIPVILDGKDTSAIIPAIEALCYPAMSGRNDVVESNGDYGKLISMLKNHLASVLKKGICLFEDGGWKLSANSSNSWISKIFLSEFVAEYILDMKYDYQMFDQAHANWWRKGCPSNPGIDQILEGTQSEYGFHYPRCVTSILWLQSCKTL